MKTEIKEVPEGCKLVAVWGGDGWLLEVNTQEGDCVAILEWPKAWPDSMTSEQLEKIGFEIA